MKPLSYRTRLRLKQLGIGLLAAIAVLLFLVIAYIVYLQRYLVYDAEGARLSFLHPEVPVETPAPPQTDTADFPAIEIGEPGIAVRPNTPLPGEEDRPALLRHYGYVLDYAALRDPQACLDRIHADEDCNTVALQLKTRSGQVYYSSRQANVTLASIDTDAVNELIATLDREGYHLIALLSAFADTAYALEHIPSALPLSSGALWMDSNGYYWLNAADTDTITYLGTLATELSALGVDEIAFSEFQFPASENIAYRDLDAEARDAALSSAASQLINLGVARGFEVSFLNAANTAPMPSENGHLIFTDVEGSLLADLTAQYAAFTTDPTRFLFFTDSRDTRFAPFGVLRTTE